MTAASLHRRWIKFISFAALLLPQTLVLAQDIDLYVGVQPGATNKPKVLIILDNTANWNNNSYPNLFVNLKSALTTTVNDLNENFEVGVMLFAETDKSNSNDVGGYVRAAIRVMDNTNKSALHDMVNSLHVLDDKGNQATWGLVMAEAYAYFRGRDCNQTGSRNEKWCIGQGKTKRDYAGNSIAGMPHSNAVWALPGNAFSSATSTTYVSPVQTGVNNNCAANYIIFISNGPPNEDTDLINKSTNILRQAAAGTLVANTVDNTIPLNPSGRQTNLSDEWARFLAGPHTGIANQVNTYTIDVNPGSTGQGPDTTALLKSMANQGQGKYFAVNDTSSATQLAQALATIFSEIRSVNSVFASASLPLNAQAQGTFLNQVFVGLFRPQEDAHPRWDGNLKQYQFKLVGTGEHQRLVLADANGDPCIGAGIGAGTDARIGLIARCAQSFWTPAKTATPDNYWAFAQHGTTNNPGSKRPPGICSAVANSAWSNSPDGNIAERGGAAHMLRNMTVTGRNMLTCNGDCPGVNGTLTAFTDANGNITQTALGASGAAERSNIINWTRGQDLTWSCGAATCGNEDADGNTREMRPSVHGDVVHGRPLPVDYPAPHGGVVVFYGANDGALRAVNGNKTGQIGGRNPGEEIWSFVATEHYGQLKRLRDQYPLLQYPGAPASTPARERKSWFFDGPIGAWRNVTVVGGQNVTSVWIYPTMRRGGRMLYAFDVSDPTAPSVKWKRGCPLNLAQGMAADDNDCDSGFAALGQTWSEPRIVRVQGHSGPVMIVGGGYDPCEDNEPNSCSSPKGNRVFVLNADTGALLASLTTVRSVAADVTVVDADANGYVDKAYVADTGGNIYRLNIGADAPANWTLTQVAALGCDSPPCSASGTLNRKFLQAPEVVVTPTFNAVLVGSGDREHPLHSQQAMNVANAFFMVMDKPGEATWLSSESANCNNQGLICLASLESVNAPVAGASLPALPADLKGKKGWALRFGANPGAGIATSAHTGEQVVTSAVVVAGIVYFSTHTPQPLRCDHNLGLSRGYAMNFLTMEGMLRNGTPFFSFSGGGLPPSPVAGIVTVTNSEGAPVNVPFIIGAAVRVQDINPIQPMLVNLNVITRQRARTYWYLEK